MANKFEIVISAADRATAIVRKINRSIEQMIPAKALSNSVKSLGKELGFDRVGKSLNNVGKAAGDVATKVGSIVAPMAAITGIGSISGIALLANEWGKLGGEVTRTSFALGVSTDKMQAWRGLGKTFGITAEQTTESIRALGDTMEDALYGRNQTALLMMNKLGISIHHLKDGTIDTTRSLMDISRVMSKIKSPQVRSLVARTFGVEEMLPVLVQGPKAIAAYQERVQQLGGVMDAKATAAANRFSISVNMLEISLGGLKNTIASKLIPVMQPFVDRLTDWIGKNRGLIASKLDNFLQALAKWLEKIDFDKVLNSISQFIDKINNTVDAMGGWKNAIIGLAIIMNGSLIASVINLGMSLGGLTLTTIPAAIKGLGLLAAAAGGPRAAIGQLASMIATGGAWGAGIAAAGAVGYGAGWAINKGIDKGLTAITGHDASLGTVMYDVAHRDYDPNKKNINAPSRTMAPGRVHVTIEHKNAPPGTTVKVNSRGGATASARIEHAMPAVGG